MLTRRCTQRQFLLRPSKKINNILLYCLAVAAERYGMHVHAFFFASNHWHGIASDPHGNRPEFCRWFHEFTSKAINAHLGRRENLWSNEQTSVVDLVPGEPFIAIETAERAHVSDPRTKDYILEVDMWGAVAGIDTLRLPNDRDEVIFHLLVVPNALLILLECPLPPALRRLRWGRRAPLPAAKPAFERLS